MTNNTFGRFQHKIKFWKCKSILTLKPFEQIIWGYTSTCDFGQFYTDSVFHNEHLYVSYTSTSLIWRRLRYKDLFRSYSSSSSSTNSRLDTCRHMYGHLLTSDSAYSRAVCRAIMAAIMRLSNIAIAYVHSNCGEWRSL